MALKDRGRRLEAVQTFEKAQEIRPDDPVTRNNLEETRHKLKPAPVPPRLPTVQQVSMGVERLNALIGLQPVKARVDALCAVVELWQRRKEAGLAVGDPPTLHMVFTGNPGTGKTTVARCIGEIYRDLGLLRRGHVIEVTGKDLIGAYVGWTAIQTNHKIEEALDGVLFIDEAYALSENQSDQHNFGREAIDTLLKRMEDDRHRLVVIVAGYPDKMRAFRSANPGLPRRFPEDNMIEFPDCTPPELMAILQQMLLEKGYQLSAEMLDTLRETVEGLYAIRNETFGNGGDMRNLADALEQGYAVRVHKGRLPLDEPLRPEDIPERLRPLARGPVPTVADLLHELGALVGLQPVKDFIRTRVRLLQLGLKPTSLSPGAK